MKTSSAFFYRISSGWLALIGLAIFLVFSMLTLPEQNAMTEYYSKGMGSPDTSLFYSGGTLLKMAEIYGQAGRSAFLKARWGFDVAFPVIYTFFFTTSLSFLFKYLDKNHSKYSWINLLPLFTMGFDFAENTATSVVMARFPSRNTWGQIMAPLLTPAKWFFLAINTGFILIGLIFWLNRVIVEKQRKHHLS